MPAFKTPTEYLASLPDDRRDAIKKVRAVIRKNLPKGYKEGIQYGMIGYFVPHSVYPDGYHCDPTQPLPFVSIASQKNHMAVYLMCLYGDPAQMDWFQKAWAKTGKKLDMGKSCVRFKRVEDIPIELIGEAVARFPVDAYIKQYEGARAGTGGASKKKTTKRSAKKKTVTTKKVAAKSAVKKKTTTKKTAKRKAVATKKTTKKTASRAKRSS